ncbi:hypothetical protein FRC04_004342 [Tulasnella sp. 424]|nr:hypothetical protein FRC04_004342 [Tulasnella sp. 424]KAG8979458.1 hypothetical protein FRC05_008444 [Tulasnella sp. 425]
MATPETTAKTETIPANVVAKDESATLMTSPTPVTGSNSDYLTSTAASQPDPFNLTPSTRPEAERAVSELSNVTQPSSTPRPDLSTAPPTSTPAATHVAPVTVEDEPEVDPKVASLQAMFPGFDAGVLESILEASGGDEDQAIDTLLGMSDPEYKPSSAHHDQTDLDEQLAHRLHLEEQARADYEARHGGSRPVPAPARDSGYQSEGGPMGGVDMGAIGAQVRGFLSGAAAKVSGTGLARGPGGNAQQQGAVGSPTSNVNTAEIRQQFNDLAETGKKHFNTLVTKVKAKMQEYDTPGPGQPGGPQQGSNKQSAGYNYYGQGNPTYGSQATYGSQSNQRPQQEWYPQPVGIQPQPAINTPPAPQQQPVVGYNVDPPTPQVPPKNTLPPTGPSASGSTPAATGVLGVSQPGMPQRSSFDQSEAPRATFDTSRLGLKPKRPVSLVGNNNGTAATDSAASKGKNKVEEDDDIEYVNETGR